MYWLSFCDPKLPKGSQFLGVAIVSASTMPDAIIKSWADATNPGGEVQGVKLPEEVHSFVVQYTGRLLNATEARVLDAAIGNILME